MAPEAAVDQVVSRIIDAYQHCGGMSFCYGQGSVLAGLTHDSDIDIVMIWEGEAPAGSSRPVRTLADAGTEPVQFDGSFGGLDNLQVDGWPVDVAHYTQDEFERWVRAVNQGDGWQERAWPLPLFAVSGFAYGVVLADSNGIARRTKTQALRVPTALVHKTRVKLDQDWPDLRSELLGCVDRSDGWLFHELAGDLLRLTYITWFAAHHRYCPFPKRMAGWAERFGFEPELLEIEQRIWRTPTLEERLVEITALVEGVLGIAKPSSV